MTQKFCEHQKCEPCKPPRCTAHIFNNEHPLCAYTDVNFADYNCKAFREVKPPTLDERVTYLESRIETIMVLVEKFLTKRGN